MKTLIIVISSLCIYVSNQPDKVINITIYEVPFDVHLRRPLDSITIKDFTLTRKHQLTNKERIKNILDELQSLRQFHQERCELDLRIYAEVLYANGDLKTYSVGSTRLLNMNDHCFNASNRLIRLLCGRKS